MNEFTIRKNVPMPPPSKRGTSWRILSKQMEFGDCVDLESEDSARCLISALYKGGYGMRRQRFIDGTVRVWKTEKRTQIPKLTNAEKTTKILTAIHNAELLGLDFYTTTDVRKRELIPLMKDGLVISEGVGKFECFHLTWEGRQYIHGNFKADGCTDEICQETKL